MVYNHDKILDAYHYPFCEDFTDIVGKMGIRFLHIHVRGILRREQLFA